MSILTTLSPFKLRAPPFTGIGGMYATGNGENVEITIDPEIGKSQTWRAREVEGTGGGFVIVDVNDESYGWTYTEPEVALTLSESPSLWRVKVVDRPNGKLVINLIADNGIIGATWYAGTAGNAVVITPIPVIPDAPEAPVWEVSPATDE